MVLTLIVFLAIVIFMAVFIGKNLQNVCSLWLFKSFENVPSAVLVLFAFAAGIVFCILLIIIFKLKKSLADEPVDKSSVQLKREKQQKKEEILEKKAALKREKTEKKLKNLQAKNKNKEDGSLLQKAEEIHKENDSKKENEQK